MSYRPLIVTFSCDLEAESATKHDSSFKIFCIAPNYKMSYLRRVSTLLKELLSIPTQSGKTLSHEKPACITFQFSQYAWNHGCVEVTVFYSKASKNELRSARDTRGGSRIFFRRGCTRLLLYFNTNKPHSFFGRIPVVLENRRSSRGGGDAPPAPSP